MKLLLNIGKARGGKDEWVEPVIDNENTLALNYVYDNLHNPSAYVSEYSFTIKVKRIPENERLFYNMTRLDSINDGFNPASKYEYIIISDYTDIISRGSCFVDFISDNEISMEMLGSLNFVFNKLLNSGWSETKATEDEEYTLLPDYLKFNGSTYTNRVRIDRTLVAGSWYIDNPIYNLQELKSNYGNLSTLYNLPLGSSKCFCNSLIGFAPTNCGYYEGFSPDKWYYEEDKDYGLIPVFATNANQDYQIKVTDRQACEYRSYYQKPYIYVNKLFQIYEEQFSGITEGWALELDDRWFNDGNPLYLRSVYTLPNLFDGKDEEENEIIDYSTDSGEVTMNCPTLTSNTQSTFEEFNIVSPPLNTVLTQTLGTKTLSPTETMQTVYEVDISSYIPSDITEFFYGVPITSNRPIYFNFQTNAIIFEFKFTLSGIIELDSKKYAVVPLPDLRNSNEQYVYNIPSSLSGYLRENGCEIVTYRYTATTGTNRVFPFGKVQLTTSYTNSTLQTRNVRETVDIYMYRHQYEQGNTPFVWNHGGIARWIYPYIGTPSITFNAVWRYGEMDTQRSGSEVTMQRLFNSTNPFNVLLKYTKMNNLIWVVDDYAKKVKVIHRYDYFMDCMTKDTNSKIPQDGNDLSYIGFLDITPYVEIGKDYEIRIPSWDTHSVTFNFGEGEEEYADGYNEKYGRAFGSKFIITENRKNNENTNLFCNNEYDTILPPVTSTQIIQPYIDIKSLSYNRVETEGFISNVSDDKPADITDRFFVRKENTEWKESINSEYREGYVIISDDMGAEFQNNEFAYHGGEYANYDVQCTKCPQFDYKIQHQGMVFGYPREIYTERAIQPEYYTLYDLYWKNYIENVYEGTNKKLTCYVKMNAMMYRRLKANPLVKYENCTYLVSSIEGWNEDNEITKVTLVQIADIDALTNFQLSAYYAGNYFLWDDEDVLCFDNGDAIEL